PKASPRADRCGSPALSCLSMIWLVLAFVAASGLHAAAIPDMMTGRDGAATATEINKKRRDLQVPFIMNQGQTDERVKFYAKTLGGTIYVTRHGEIVYDLPKRKDQQTAMGWSLKEELIGAHVDS